MSGQVHKSVLFLLCPTFCIKSDNDEWAYATYYSWLWFLRIQTEARLRQNNSRTRGKYFTFNFIFFVDLSIHPIRLNEILTTGMCEIWILRTSLLTSACFVSSTLNFHEFCWRWELKHQVVSWLYFMVSYLLPVCMIWSVQCFSGAVLLHGVACCCPLASLNGSQVAQLLFKCSVSAPVSKTTHI